MGSREEGRPLGAEDRCGPEAELELLSASGSLALGNSQPLLSPGLTPGVQGGSAQSCLKAAGTQGGGADRQAVLPRPELLSSPFSFLAPLLSHCTPSLQRRTADTPFQILLSQWHSST